ncbi:MAG: TetR/AcrR family transcriptional regulator [Acidimicrobiales bacterium]|nr:TetR/AcrR family transcriptional regulator [Acidimicrobiales bacterium]
MTSDTAAGTDPRVARSREKLLDAATELLVESGARGVTVDAVAERSGVAKSTLYRHWSSRTELLTDVLRSNVPEIDVPDLELGFQGALRALVAQLAGSLADPRQACILPAIFALRQQIPEVGELSERDQDEKTEAIRVVLELGVDEGVIPAGLDPTLVGYQLLGPLVLAALTGNQVDTAALADQLVDRFVGSMGA